MEVTDWTTGTMRLDGGHPALELVNTIYGQVGQPPEHDVLAAPEDLVVLARRTGLIGDAVPSAAALRAARALRGALDPVLRGGGSLDPGSLGPVLQGGGSLAPVERAAARAVAAGRLEPGTGWTWPADDAMAPVHAFALAAVALLSDAGELGRVRACAGCCWLFLDHSRGGSRRWCSMADCGTEAKKRRYVAARRARRAAARGD
ncbi:MAG TPA: CGNR zinc finger domain-containing protein [Solirubrobacteraceae bacterium]|nr:CGNR zinc finger domain-containing protein [Solirubrobacteraceae bacterium]